MNVKASFFRELFHLVFHDNIYSYYYQTSKKATMNQKLLQIITIPGMSFGRLIIKISTKKRIANWNYP